jgi:hypothetical protein
MAKCIWQRVVLLGLVVSKNYSSLGYKYSRFLSTSVVYSLGYGWALETPVIDRK